MLSLLSPILTLPSIIFGGWTITGVEGIFFLTILSIWILLIAALIPDSPEETWGSMWPLVGYDNVVDALYVRGPWLQRFEELDEIEVQNRMTTAMSNWF